MHEGHIDARIILKLSDYLLLFQLLQVERRTLRSHLKIASVIPHNDFFILDLQGIRKVL